MGISVTRAVYDSLAQAVYFKNYWKYTPGNSVSPSAIADLLGVCCLTVQNWEAHCDGPSHRAITPNEPAQSKIAYWVARFPNYETYVLRNGSNPDFWAKLSKEQATAAHKAIIDSYAIREKREFEEARLKAEAETKAKSKELADQELAMTAAAAKYAELSGKNVCICVTEP
jgi:hypothetical protein